MTIPEPDIELYDSSPVHTESYRRGYRNGFLDGVLAARAQLVDALSEINSWPELQP